MDSLFNEVQSKQTILNFDTETTKETDTSKETIEAKKEIAEQQNCNEKTETKKEETDNSNETEEPSKEERQCYTVTEINSMIEESLQAIGSIWVEGEITELTSSTKGHIYITLKDSQNTASKTNQIRVTVWNFIAQKLSLSLKIGDKIQIYGCITIYASQYNMTAKIIDMCGEGKLWQEYLMMKHELQKLGYFDKAHKKKMPFLPKTIGIVTSKNGAAIKDILNNLLNRFPNVHVMIFDVPVQGKGAAEEIAKMIDWINQIDLGIQVLIIGRGGGSIEDLWAFNEKVVADAIYNSNIPILSAVGHERDHLISDEVADDFAITPTHAAEKIIPKLQDLEQCLNQQQDKLQKAIFNFICTKKTQLDGLEHHRALSKPQNDVIYYKQKLNEIEQKLPYLLRDTIKTKIQFLSDQERKLQRFQPTEKVKSLQEQLFYLEKQLIQFTIKRQEDAKNQLQNYQYRLDALNPYAVLGRGYNITYSQDGKLITNKEQVHKGDFIWTRMENTWIKSQVLDTGDNPK